MESRASNFLAAATYDDGSCVIIYEGCTDPSSLNYRPIANLDDGSCVYVGCMDSRATNYDQTANFAGACMLNNCRRRWKQTRHQVLPEPERAHLV